MTAKVLQISDVTSVYSRITRKDLSKCDVVLADLSGVIVITLCQESEKTRRVLVGFLSRKIFLDILGMELVRTNKKLNLWYA